jgi:TonB family protein
MDRMKPLALGLLLGAAAIANADQTGDMQPPTNSQGAQVQGAQQQGAKVPDAIAISDIDPAYAAAVLSAVHKHVHYPFGDMAGGTSHVKVICSRDGTVQHYDLLSSSGDRFLDEAAEKALSWTRKLPPVPEAFHPELSTVSLDVPVEFDGVGDPNYHDEWPSTRGSSLGMSGMHR